MGKYVYICLLLCTFSTASLADWTEQTRDTSDFNITIDTVTLRVRTMVDDPNSATGTIMFSTATIEGLINTGHRLMCINIEALTTSATMQLVAGTTEYAIPIDCMYVERLTVDFDDDNGEQYFKQKTPWGLDMETSGWNLEKSSPTAFYLRNRQIGFYPAPEYSGGEVTMWYIKFPGILSGSDKVFDGYTQLEPYWDLLAVYAAGKLFQIMGMQDQASVMFTEFTGGINNLRTWWGKNPLYLPIRPEEK